MGENINPVVLVLGCIVFAILATGLLLWIDLAIGRHARKRQRQQRARKNGKGKS